MFSVVSSLKRITVNGTQPLETISSGSCHLDFDWLAVSIYSIYSVPAQYLLGTCTVSTQYSTYSVANQFLHSSYSIYTVSTRYPHSIYTVSTQYLHSSYSIYTVPTQYLHSSYSIYTVPTQYLHSIYSIYSSCWLGVSNRRDNLPKQGKLYCQAGGSFPTLS